MIHTQTHVQQEIHGNSDIQESGVWVNLTLLGTYGSAQLPRELRQEDYLSLQVREQPGQHIKTPISKKKKKKKKEERNFSIT
jgi:hypothetical protein